MNESLWEHILIKPCPDLQPSPIQVYAEVNPIVFIGVYSQDNVHRIVALDTYILDMCAKLKREDNVIWRNYCHVLFSDYQEQH